MSWELRTEEIRLLQRRNFLEREMDRLEALRLQHARELDETASALADVQQQLTLVRAPAPLKLRNVS